VVGQPQLRLSTAACDPEWDRFLSTTPGGHHLQSSLWGQVKSVLGWRAVRVAAVCDGRIRGGAQLLLRRLPAVGSVGYVPLGPVLDRDDPALRDAVLRWVQLVGRRSSTRFLVVQPPAGHEGVVDALRTGGFREARWLLEPHPSATLLVDLAQPEEALLAAMKRGTRYNVRLAQRKGVTVREGSPAVRYRGEFYGQSSGGDPLPDAISSAALNRLIGSLDDGISEMSCHPARDSAVDSGYGPERSIELRALCDPSIRDSLPDRGIRLVSFAQVGR